MRSLFSPNNYKKEIMAENVSPVDLDSLSRNLRLYSSSWVIRPIFDFDGPDYQLGIPVPSFDHRKRVASHVALVDPDGFEFLQGGRYNATALANIASTYGKSIGEELSLLDWGCGCGKLARFIPPQWRSNYTGIDIDHVNISWCREN